MPLVKQKQKISKRPKLIWMEPWLKNEKNNTEAHVITNIFSELLLTDKLLYYLQMNATSCYWLHIDFYTLLFYITYTYTYRACIDYFIIYWFLQFTAVHVFHFYKQILLYYEIKTIELMTREAVSFEKVFHRKFFLAF